MNNIEQYLTKAQAEMDKALKRKAYAEDSGLVNHGILHYQAAVYHILEANYYQNQAIIELLKGRKTE